MKTPSPLTLVSLNMEGSKHLKRVIPFLGSRAPDVICLQEVMEDDFHAFRERFGMHGEYARMTKVTRGGIARFGGVAILARHPLEQPQKLYYYYEGSPDSLPEKTDNVKTVFRPLLSAEVLKEDTLFIVGTTHFTWTPDGQASPEQRRDADELLKLLRGFSEVILCGDFNAPRGGEIFSRIAERYYDNIPKHYETSLDENLHRTRGKTRLMVDGLFTSPGYRAENVELVCGVSDHCAITADIFKV